MDRITQDIYEMKLKALDMALSTSFGAHIGGGFSAMESMLQQIALGRIAKSDEVARTAVFLASDESSYMTGQIIRVDGGI